MDAQSTIPLAERPVDFLVVGLGNKDYPSSRHNAGFIFVEYLKVAKLRDLENATKTKKVKGKVVEVAASISLEERVLSDIRGEDGAPKYDVPLFVRLHAECAADVHDVELAFSDDVANGTAPTTSNASEDKSYRIILAKPLTPMNDSGFAVRSLVEYYGIKNTKKQLIIVYDDMNVIPGSINIADTKDARKPTGHRGVLSVSEKLGTDEYIRFKIGIGMPMEGVATDAFVLYPFASENREMDLLGYSLDLSAHALQLYASSGSLEKARKKYACSKKLPNTLRKMQGVIFPIRLSDPVLDAQIAKEAAEKAEQESKPTQPPASPSKTKSKK